MRPRLIHYRFIKSKSELTNTTTNDFVAGMLRCISELLILSRVLIPISINA